MWKESLGPARQSILSGLALALLLAASGECSRAAETPPAEKADAAKTEAPKPEAAKPDAAKANAAKADAAKSESAKPKIDPKVTEILQAACKTLASAKTMSFKAVDTYERAARNGQPLYYSVLSQVKLQRPDKLRVSKLGDGIPDEFYYDGKAMAAYVPSADLIAVASAPPTIDKMLDMAWDVGAIYFPFADVIVSDPCRVFNKVTSSFYVGQSVVVGGTRTDMVAVSGDGIQAELWIGTTDHLPRMVRVTYPKEPARARYQTEYSGWKLGGTVDPGTFRTTKTDTAKRIAFSPPGIAPRADGAPRPASGTPVSPPPAAPRP